MEVEFDNVQLVVAAAITKTTTGENQHDHRRQQQDAPCGRKFLQNGPEKFLDDVQAASALGEIVGSLGGNVAGIEAVTGAGFGFELRPELRELETLSDAPPKPLQPHSQRRALSGGWWGGSCHEIQ